MLSYGLMSGPITYATTRDGLHVAYLVSGTGSVPMIEVTNGTVFSIDATSDQPCWQGYVDRLGQFSQLIRFDRRGLGLSDPLGSVELPTVEHWAADVLAVLDALQISQAVLLAVSFGGLPAIEFAASHPERVRALVLVNAFACLLRGPDYPIGVPAELYKTFVDGLVDPGADRPLDDLPLMVPSKVGDPEFASWWRQAGHRGASPATARSMLVSSATDVRSMLGAIQAPTLVIHAASDRFVRVDHGRYLAEHIHGAHYVELATGDHVPWAAEVDFTGEIEEFLTGTRHVVVSDRLLSTVLFTDIVGSTQHAAAIGDQRWRERLQQHDLAVERQIKRFGGRLVKNIGDGVLATFDGPARAISCALTIRDAVRQLGLEVRVGLHTGEIERRGDDVAGIAVHLAQRVMDTAMPGEVLVSRTVVDLVAGSGIEFVDRGEHQLRGIPGSWRLHAVC
jgi:class 3 adenylate cyclase